MLSSYGTQNILQVIIGVQMFTWVISFWYYYVKYKISEAQNRFYQIISSRHYNYVLSRISTNASFQWLNEKSPLELTKQIDSTEKGLHTMFTFLTQSVRLLSIIIMSIIVISWNYPTCSFVFIGFFSILYAIINKKTMFNEYYLRRQKFALTNQQNSSIISDNIYLLLDAVLHGSSQQIINNVVIFNSKTKKEQMAMYNKEDLTYTKIGLLMISAYIIMLTMASTIMHLTFDQFIVFFIASLLTYKCINHNINELCNMYTDVRQSQLDFDNMCDIWANTKKTRKEYEQTELFSKPFDFNLLKDFFEYKFMRRDTVQMRIYEDFIKSASLQQEFSQYSGNSLKSIIDSYYICNAKEMKKLEVYRNFVMDKCNRIDKFHAYINDDVNKNVFNDNISSLYFDYVSSNNLNKNTSTFTIKINKLIYHYPKTESGIRHCIKYISDEPLILKSNSHILIEGPSGAGKSSLLKIIRGVIPVEKLQNDNCLDMTHQNNDNEAENILWSNLSNSVCYCQQNSVSFISGTIYQLLSDDYLSDICDVPESTRILMLKSLAVACVDPRFRSIKYYCSKDTMSGGQCQRLIVAKNIYRAMNTDKQIIICDEVDAGLDLATAENLVINLNMLLKEKMFLIVLHTEELKNLFKNRILIKSGIISHNLQNECHSNINT